MKALLARYAARTEDLIDALRGDRVFEGPVHVEAYIGYATPTHLVARGRVLSRPAHSAKAQTALEGLRESIARFLTDEIAGVTVEAHGVATETDEEGHFRLVLPREVATTPQDGWTEVAVHLPAHGTMAELPVRLPSPGATLGVISDIDDTLIETGAYSLLRNLRTSLTGTLASRVVFDDSRDLLAALAAPTFYVSSSPWNLHPFLEAVFERGGLPRGPKFLRDFGLDEARLVTGTHGDHKGEAIDTIMDANPGLGFLLMGDTGQHDAQVYLAALRRHPGRVRAVALRQAGPLDREDAEARAALEASGVPVLSGERFDAAAVRAALA